ncbi:hypothetical protein HA402_013704 [Bradysia odoriphaga]|nr:hypothetical protein HA402_013704 [Bradysia odoriphaga]
MVICNTTTPNRLETPVAYTKTAVPFGRCNSCSQAKQLAEILFDYCSDCSKIDMPALPQSAFAVSKIRANMEKNMTVAKVKTGDKQQPDNHLYPNKKLMDYTPAKYNSKFMNAIWGHYNRYSPHNIKSQESDSQGDCTQHQQYRIAAAGNDILKKVSLNGVGWEFKV